jgi:transposase
MKRLLEMGGKRTTREELTQLEALTEEGLTCREIAERLGRSEASIRNLRYKKHLVARAEDETKALFQQRDELANLVKALQEQKTALALEVNRLSLEKGRLIWDVLKWSVGPEQKARGATGIQGY